MSAEPATLPATRADEPERQDDGRFKAGSSGNPGGRTKAEQNVAQRVREFAGRYSEEAIKGLVNIARNRRVPKATRIAAYSAILDRAVGKPVSPQPWAYDDGAPAGRLHSDSDFDVARRLAYLLSQGLRAQQARQLERASAAEAEGPSE
jgi:hypothetical protein